MMPSSVDVLAIYLEHRGGNRGSCHRLLPDGVDARKVSRPRFRHLRLRYNISRLTLPAACLVADPGRFLRDSGLAVADIRASNRRCPSSGSYAVNCRNPRDGWPLTAAGARPTGPLSKIEARVGAQAFLPQPVAEASGHEVADPEKSTFAALWTRRLRRRTIALVIFHLFQVIGYFGFSNWLPTLLVSAGDHRSPVARVFRRPLRWFRQSHRCYSSSSPTRWSVSG